MIVQIKETSEFLFLCFPFQFDIIFFYMKILSCKLGECENSRDKSRKQGHHAVSNSTGSHLNFVSHKQLPFGTRGKRKENNFKCQRSCKL